jgi:hypothetical protein
MSEILELERFDGRFAAVLQAMKTKLIEIKMSVFWVMYFILGSHLPGEVNFCKMRND